LNFKTLRPRSAILADYKHILEQVYNPAAFFARARRLGRLLRRPKIKSRFVLASALNDALTLVRLGWRLVSRHPNFIRPFLAVIFDCALRNPTVLHQLMGQLVLFLHVGPFANYVVNQIDRELATLDAGSDQGWVAPMQTAAVHIDQPATVGKAVATLH
jgi:hypothetical protein